MNPGTKVALAALKGERPTSKIAAPFEIHPTIVSQWKRELLNNATGVFGSKSPGKVVQKTQEGIDTLYREIGKLTVVRDFSSRRLGR
ncbi:hypothetical protein LCW13_06575 [Cobetia amphilecti]|uniref:hypothetical protein n=1 Tax=Cobetia amphilecti TaxID=1055104 RepID=UPI001CDAB53E|nr:hypothetical protein [Cobetia amphilecti]UBU49912.1 hypothetical protein LCW13_06575 [Cobetia amphilecti]